MRMAYNDFVASLIDQGEGHWTIICKAVQANKDGVIHIPVKKWITFEQLLSSKPSIQKYILDRLKKLPTACLLNEAASTQKFRFVLQTEQWTDEQLKKLAPWQVRLIHSIPVLNNMPTKKISENLRDFGVINAHGQWCEVQFQRFLKISALVKRKAVKVTRGHFLLMVHNMATLKGKITSDEVPFSWTLGHIDMLSNQQIDIYYRLAQKILSILSLALISNKQYIKRREFAHLQLVLYWMFPNLNAKEPQFFSPADYPVGK